MSDRNCWKCHHQHTNRTQLCGLFPDATQDVRDAVDGWLDTVPLDERLMPPPETATACPGFAAAMGDE